MGKEQQFGSYRVEAPKMLSSTISPHVLLGPEISFDVSEQEMETRNMTEQALKHEKEGKYMRRIINLAHAQRIANYIVEPGRTSQAKHVEEILAQVKLAGDEETYQAMQQRFNSIALPAVGLDPKKPEDVSLFDALFRAASSTHNTLNENAQSYIKLAADPQTASYTEMLQETKSANTPLDLLQLMFDKDSERLRYEGTRKFIGAFYNIPSLLERGNINGAGKDIMTILKKEGVVQGEKLFPHTIVAKVNKSTGQCIEWEDFDPELHTDLQSGTYLDEETGKTAYWKQLVFSMPSRHTKEGLPIHFTSREKFDESLQFKTMRKLEKTHKDTLAFRVVFDEHKKDITEQIMKFYQDSIDAFEKNGYRVKISEPQRQEDGTQILNGKDYTNTITRPFSIRIQQADSEGKAQYREYYAFPKSNEKNPSTNGKRQVFQADWVLEKNGHEITFEMQCIDTKGEINREVSEWSDAAYKADQFFRPAKPEGISFMQLMYPPHYLEKVNILEYHDAVIKKIRSQTLNDPSREIMPNKTEVVVYEEK